MAALRAAIAALQDKVQRKQRQLRELSATNERLQVRAASLHLLARVTAEADAARAAFGVACEHSAAERRRLEALLEEDGARWTAAVGVGAASPGTAASAGGSCHAGACIDALSEASGQPPPPLQQEQEQQQQQQQQQRQHQGGSDSCGGSASVTTSGPASTGPLGAAAARGDDLLTRLPHLQPGTCLLHVQGTPPEAVADYASMDANEAKSRWRDLVDEALVIQGDCASEEQLDAALGRCAVKMLRWKNLLLLLNPRAFQPLTYTRYDADGASLMYSNQRDAPHDHWQHALFEGARLSRHQGLLIVDAYRLCEERVKQLHAERADLAARLQRLAAPGGGAAAGGGMGGVTQEEICAALEANSGAEWATLVMMWLALPAVFSLPQWARFISSCWPFPADEKICVQLVEEALTSAPQLFHDGAR